MHRGVSFSDENKTFTITADSGKDIQDVMISNYTHSPIDLGKVPSYTFENIQQNYTFAASFTPYSLQLVAGSTTKNLNPTQFDSLPGYGATFNDNNEATWKGVPLYKLIEQIYPGDSTTYNVSAITSDPTNNDITFINNSDYPFLDPDKKDLFIVADRYSTDDGVTWTSVPPAASGNGGWTWAPLRLIGNPNGSGNSSAFRHFGAGLVELELTNIAPWIAAQPKNKTVSAGATASFTASANGDPAPTVQWQVSSDKGSTWSDISGATNTTLTLNAVTTSLSGHKYHAVFTNSAGSVTSNAVTLTVTPASSGGGGGGGGGGGSVNTTVITNLFGSTSSLSVNSAGIVQQLFKATSTDGVMSLTIPAGTTAKNSTGNPITNLNETANTNPPPPPSGTAIIGSAFNFEPSGATFTPPIVFNYRSEPSQLPEGVAEADLVLAFYDTKTGNWVNLSGTLDATNHTITVPLSHFTTFAVMGTLPAAFTPTLQNVSPQEVAPGDKVNIAASVSNTGGKDGDYLATLMINGIKEQEQSVKVRAGGNADLVFTVSKDQPGDYTVSIGGAEGKFTVISPAVFSLSNLSIQPARVEPGETVTVSAVVSNTGGKEGIYPVVLMVNGVKEQEKNVTVAANSNQTVIFELTEDMAGDYNVAIDKSAGSFIVEAVVPPSTQAPPTSASTAGSEKVTNRPISWALIGGILAVVVAIILFVFWWTKRKRF